MRFLRHSVTSETKPAMCAACVGRASVDGSACAFTYCHFDGLHALGLYDGSLFGMLGMDISHVNSAHIVAVDELGTVEPSDDVTTYH
jgi:hypothetical protein